MQIHRCQIERLVILQACLRLFQAVQCLTGYAHVAFMGEHQFLRLAQVAAQIIAYRFQPFARFGRQAEHGTVRGDGSHHLSCDGFSRILLVEQHRTGTGRIHLQKSALIIRHRGGCIHQQQSSIRLVQSGLGAFHANLLHRVAAFTQTGGILQDHAHAIQRKAALQHIARGAWNIGYNGAILTEQSIKKRALTCVGPSAEGNVQTIAHNACPAFVDGFIKCRSVWQAPHSGLPKLLLHQFHQDSRCVPPARPAGR